MKPLLNAMLAVTLAGCSSLSALTGASVPAGQAEALRALGEHMERCDRHYQGSLGVGASFTFNIDCRSEPPQSGGG